MGKCIYPDCDRPAKSFMVGCEFHLADWEATRINFKSAIAWPDYCAGYVDWRHNCAICDSDWLISAEDKLDYLCPECRASIPA